MKQVKCLFHAPTPKDIHGGYDYGTAGCIEFADYEKEQTYLKEFDKMLLKYGKRIKLYVKY